MWEHRTQQGVITQCRQINVETDHMAPKHDFRVIFNQLLVNNLIVIAKNLFAKMYF